MGGIIGCLDRVLGEQDNDGEPWTPFTACDKGNILALKRLISRKANLNETCDRNLRGALHGSCTDASNILVTVRATMRQLRRKQH